MNPILLDTHVAIWAAEGKLEAPARDRISSASERDEIFLSPISAWEIGVLVQKKRVTLAGGADSYVRRLFAGHGVVVAPLTPAIAVAATMLPGVCHGDAADRILIATAAAYGASLMTRDSKIQDYARATKHIRCIAC